jgi:hypothetical protein
LSRLRLPFRQAGDQPPPFYHHHESHHNGEDPVSEEARGVALWAVRMVLLWLGGYLTARGVGDAALWSGVADQVAGALVMLAASLWSYRARKAQLAALPPESKP